MTETTASPVVGIGPSPVSQPKPPATVEAKTVGPRMHTAHSGATTAAVTKAATGLSDTSCLSYSPATRDGKPIPAVAAIRAVASVFASSKVTRAFFSA